MRTIQHPADSTKAGPPGEADGLPGAGLARWQAGLHERIAAVLDSYVHARCDEHVHGVPGADLLTELLAGSVAGGKYVRSTFTYLGWLCGAGEDAADDDAALRAAASIELLHAFALIQDDVMDRSVTRRGRMAAHARLAEWYSTQHLTGDAQHFGESAALLLSDLLLVWSERMLRDSGLSRPALARGLPVYDMLRGELAVGQFADLLYDARHLPPYEAVLEMSRRKSGNYTVRRPLELGAALAGAPEPARAALSRYGNLVGEAFQLRDDLLGIFGQPSVTGKPNSGDLREHKATTVVALAAELAAPAQRAELTRLLAREHPAEPDLARMRELITGSGAAARTEQLIGSLVKVAQASLDGAGLAEFPQAVLRDLAVRATVRAS